VTDLLTCPQAEFFATVDEWTEQEQDDALYARCETDLELFCSGFFPDRFLMPFNVMHLDFMARPKQRWNEREEQQKVADAAPRGGAKSTIESYANLVHDVVYGFELYVPIISTTYDLAEDLVKNLHRVFTSTDGYEDLHAIYGPFVVEGTRTDFVVKVPDGDHRGTRIKAFSFGGTIRGTNHEGVRPTKVVMDDSEHPDRVRSPTQREKVESFLKKDILKCGWSYTLFRVVGTVLHGDSMLANLLRSPGWVSTKYKAVISWPERMDLWLVARDLWRELDDEDRVENARAFYMANRVEMDRGAKVLWPESESLWDLMVLRWADGEASFNSEKQNDPVDPDRQVFDVDRFKRCRFNGTHITNANGKKIALRSCRVAFWLDPRASEEVKRNDFAAIAMVARDPQGYRYALRCEMRREKPSDSRARMWSFFENHLNMDVRYGYEDNGFAALNDEGFQRERDDRKRLRQPHTFNPKGYPSTTNKHDRILRLQPDAENGFFQFAEEMPPEVMEQFRDLGSGSHDDGPDAVERADWLLSAAMPKVKASGWGG
jgi:hypothetical protein